MSNTRDEHDFRSANGGAGNSAESKDAFDQHNDQRGDD
jgi:hypothetical protein